MRVGGTSEMGGDILCVLLKLRHVRLVHPNVFAIFHLRRAAWFSMSAEARWASKARSRSLDFKDVEEKVERSDLEVDQHYRRLPNSVV